MENKPSAQMPRNGMGGGGYQKPNNAPTSLLDAAIVRRALLESVLKLDPRTVAKNPVMFVVEVGSVLTTFYWIRELVTQTGDPRFTGQVTLWLWFTVLFANFAEAMAEGRGKAQADSLRKAKTTSLARRIVGGKEESVAGATLRRDDLIVCEAAVLKLIADNTDGRTLGVLGEAGVNVLKLNRALDAAKTTP